MFKFFIFLLYYELLLKKSQFFIKTNINKHDNTIHIIHIIN